MPPQPCLLEKQMKDFILRFQQMERDDIHPAIIAAYLHDELVRIHPFIDGNGRVCRLLMNLYLLQHGYTIVALKGDNENKVQYYKALEKSHTEHESDAFCMLVAEAEKEALQRYIQIVK